jgi:phage terminase small subunit
VSKNGFNGKRVRFVQEFIIDLNATQACIRAGYSPKSAHVTGSRLLSDAKVQAAIAEAMKGRAVRTQVTQDQVVRELAKIAFANMNTYATWGPDGVTLECSEDLTPEQAAVVGEVSETKTKDGGSIRFKLHDKEKALELLGRHLGMFTDVVKHEGELPALVWKIADEDS